MKTTLLLLFVIAAASHADPRTSSDYSIATDSHNAAGARATSAAYTNNGSAGSFIGISTATSPAATAKSGYIGQLYEVTALQLAASPTTVNEGATRQLAVTLLLDDLTNLTVPSTSISWSVLSGPLTSVDSTGLATAGTVYQDTAATAQGIYAGNTGTLGLTVVNTLPDNFGNYAGDGLDDSWQFQYFGLDNPNASPLIDPDGDGQNNRFEFIAGIVPIDPGSYFNLRVEPVTGQPAQKRLVFSPRWTDRTYNVVFSTTLETNSWSALTGGSVSDSGTERNVIDPAATAPAKFYRVEINKP